MIINMNKFVNDFNAGLVSAKGYEDGGYNLTNYIYNNQRGTRLWDYINKDVYIEFVPAENWFYIEDYGNGTPNWVPATISKMLKAVTK